MKNEILIDLAILSPEHRKKLDIRIWLYLYILHMISSEDNTVNNWDDKRAAKRLGVTLSTIIRQRKQLELDDYLLYCEEEKELLLLPLQPTMNAKQRLLAVGVEPGPVKNIVTKYSEEYINFHLEWYNETLQKGISRSPGWLVNNIIKNRSLKRQNSS